MVVLRDERGEEGGKLISKIFSHLMGKLVLCLCSFSNGEKSVGDASCTCDDWRELPYCVIPSLREHVRRQGMIGVHGCSLRNGTSRSNDEVIRDWRIFRANGCPTQSYKKPALRFHGEWFRGWSPTET